MKGTLLCLLLLLLVEKGARGRVVVPTVHSHEWAHTYPSLATEWGRPLERGVEYTARLQWLSLRLCDEATTTDMSTLRQPHDDSPVVVLALQGDCAISRQARAVWKLAQQAEVAVAHLLLYSEKDDSNEIFVSRPQGDAKEEKWKNHLSVSFVSHDTARDLIQMLQDQSPREQEAGGMLITLDGVEDGDVFQDEHGAHHHSHDLQEEWMLVILAVFFILLSLLGCLLLCSGHSVILPGSSSPSNASPSRGRSSPASSFAAREGEDWQGMGFYGRVLTLEQAVQLPEMSHQAALALQQQSTRQETSGTADDQTLEKHSKDNDKNAEDDCNVKLSLAASEDEWDETKKKQKKTLPFMETCSICLEELEPTDLVRVLPCQHLFHSDCIVPWLTQRSCTCPNCKLDLLLPPSEEQDDDEEMVASEASGWSRWWPMSLPRRGQDEERDSPPQAEELTTTRSRLEGMRIPLLQNVRSPRMTRGDSFDGEQGEWGETESSAETA